MQRNDSTIPHKFPVGSVVRLTGGGPPLTVTGHMAGGENQVAWIEMSPYGAHYPDGALKPAMPRWRVALILFALAYGTFLLIAVVRAGAA